MEFSTFFFFDGFPKIGLEMLDIAYYCSVPILIFHGSILDLALSVLDVINAIMPFMRK